jgi:hypothetical protein
LTETWLVVDFSDRLTCGDLRDMAKEAFPGISLMVVEAKGPGAWAGFGPKEEMFSWIEGCWDKS